MERWDGRGMHLSLGGGTQHFRQFARILEGPKEAEAGSEIAAGDTNFCEYRGYRRRGNISAREVVQGTVGEARGEIPAGFFSKA